MAAKDTKGTDEERLRQSKRILNSVDNSSEIIGSSSLVRSANKTRDHLMGADGDQQDRIEIWGKRIGRGLSVIVFIALALWLIDYLVRGS